MLLVKREPMIFGLSSTVAVYFAWSRLRLEDFFIMSPYDLGHAIHATVANFYVASVENLA